MKGENYIYDYRDYRAFLVDALGGKNKRTGQRGALARHLGCQTAYLSQVLNGTANLNLEQAYRVNQFLSHDSQAADFFLLLVQRERAGTHDLKMYFDEKINETLAKRSEVKSRVMKTRVITENDQAYYYSQWYIDAIHMALSIPHLQTVQELAKHFHLEETLVREALEFLVRIGLATVNRHRYSIGANHIHLGKESKFLRQLHMNWRLMAIQSLEKRREEDLHFSGVFSLSRQDVIKIRKQILRLIEENMEVIKPSKEEVLFCNTIDFYELKG